MTIEGAIADLQNLIDNDGIPFWAKPSLQKVMETVEAERERHIKERKTMTHEEAVGFLQASGWLQDHDKQIYEQGKRDGNDEHKTGKWIITKRNGILCGVCHSGFRRMPTLDGKPIFRYCPFCGAKMKGAAEDDS